MMKQLSANITDGVILTAVAWLILFSWNLFYKVPKDIYKEAKDAWPLALASPFPPPPDFAFERTPMRPPIRDDIRIQFTSSPLWTEQRKSIVREQVHSFEAYLTRWGIIKLPDILPLFSIVEGTQVGQAYIFPPNPPFDQRQIPMSTGALTPIAIRYRYANYVFDMLLSAGQIPDQSTLTFASWIYSEYFLESSLNITPDLNPKADNRWVVALREIRKEFGQDFTDRALMYSLKSPVEYSDDLNKYFRERLQQGVLVVKNDFYEYIEVNKILERHGLLH